MRLREDRLGTWLAFYVISVNSFLLCTWMLNREVVIRWPGVASLVLVASVFFAVIRISKHIRSSFRWPLIIAALVGQSASVLLILSGSTSRIIPALPYFVPQFVLLLADLWEQRRDKTTVL